MMQTESPLRNRPMAHPATLAVGQNLITIASGKGGVGKTVLAVSISHALANAGKKVLLFDGDVGMANVDIQLGVMPSKDLATVISGELSMADVTFKIEEGGFDVIAGRSGSGSLGSLHKSELTHIRDDIVQLSETYDYVILDLGAGIDEAVQTLSSGNGPKLVVTTGDPTALTDAYAYIKIMQQKSPGCVMEIIVNMAKSVNEGEKIYEKLKNACSNFLGIEPALAGIVLQDDKVASAIRAQSGLLTRYPTSDVAQNIEDIAASIMKGAAA